MPLLDRTKYDSNFIKVKALTYSKHMPVPCLLYWVTSQSLCSLNLNFQVVQVWSNQGVFKQLFQGTQQMHIWRAMLKLGWAVHHLLVKDHPHKITKHNADYFLANRHPLEKKQVPYRQPKRGQQWMGRVKLSIKSQRQSPQRQRKDLLKRKKSFTTFVQSINTLWKPFVFSRQN